MKKIIVEIVYSGAYPILVQDIQWALQDKTPKESVAVREVLQSELKQGSDSAECLSCGHVFENMYCPYCNSLGVKK